MAKDLTLTETRRKLRNEATFAERILWYSLRGSQLDGRKFTRQKGIGPYVVDFYCPEEKLVIELDGSVHDNRIVKERDIVREEYLKSNELTILRFTNDEFLQSGDSVIAKIRETWNGRERNPVSKHGGRSRKHRFPKNSTP